MSKNTKGSYQKYVKMPRTLSLDESQKLLHALRTFYDPAGKNRKAIRNYTMAVIMLDAGLRVGELVRLQQYNLCRGGEPVKSIDVTPTIAEKSGARIVPATERIQSAISKMVEVGWFDGATNGDLYAFYKTTSETHITVRQVQRIIGITGMVAIQRTVTPHMLRHTFATNMMRITNIRVVQELLGHKELTSTQVYTHPNHDDFTKAVKNLEKLTKDLTI